MNARTFKKNSHIVKEVLPGSIAEESGIVPGDELLSVNGGGIADIFDYQYQTEAEEVTLLIRKADGGEWELSIEKDEDEDLGLVFDNGLMDEYRRCCNHCIFCFIDQLPLGMRKTLYFKDDDSRLSFLQGNYVTLTNMSDDDIDRVIRYRLEPINISFQTTDPALRCKMLGNRFAGEALKKADRLNEAGIMMNGQIVLCRGINDGENLKRTISDLMEYIPNLESVSVVPVGLSRYREGLYPLEPFTAEEAAEVIRTVEAFQERCMNGYDTHFIHAADEFYVLAGKEVPPEETYDGYLQYENGVGMIRSFLDEFEEAFSALPEQPEVRGREISVAGGMMMQGYMERILERLREKVPKIRVHYYPVVNHFFGESITVSGLLTGRDIVDALKGKPLGETLYLPETLLRAGEEILLDDMSISDIASALQVKIDIVKSNGSMFLEMLLYGASLL